MKLLTIDCGLVCNLSSMFWLDAPLPRQEDPWHHGRGCLTRNVLAMDTNAALLNDEKFSVYVTECADTIMADRGYNARGCKKENQQPRYKNKNDRCG